MSNTKKQIKHFFAHTAWDLWCIGSVVGIWPRYIEPKLLSSTHLNLIIPGLPKQLQGLRILQFSDLHLSKDTPDFFLNKLIRKIKDFSPDLIVFTGDFLCYSQIDQPERLKKLLCSMSAKYGCYAILGNHDYHSYVSVNDNGLYDLINPKASTLKKGWKKLFKTITAKGTITPQARVTPLKQELLDLLQQTPFELLHNKTKLLHINGSCLNLCGLGEHMLGRCDPEQAFQNYDRSFQGIILAHNPDSIPSLKHYPGDLILCGHTHGGQVNLPGLYRKFMVLENMHLKRGLKRLDNKWIYINRGVGAVMPFRWFSMPEVLMLTMEAP